MTIYVTPSLSTLADRERTPVRDTDETVLLSSPRSDRRGSPGTSASGRDTETLSPSLCREKFELESETLTWTESRPIVTTPTVTSGTGSVTFVLVVNELVQRLLAVLLSGCLPEPGSSILVRTRSSTWPSQVSVSTSSFGSEPSSVPSVQPRSDVPLP